MEGMFGHWSEHNVIMREQNNYGSFDLARSDGNFFQGEIS